MSEALRDVARDKDARAVAEREYPMVATQYYLSLARPEATDPILHQCLPDEAEVDQTGQDDPLAEERDSPVPGLVHRYPDRALLVVTNRCAVRCRHCLRKRIWGDRAVDMTDDRFEAAARYLEETPSIREVLVSGGDPFLLSNETLAHRLERLRRIPNLEILRVGTRVPAVLPSRITAEFAALVGAYRPLWVDTQFNHPRELTDAAQTACEQLTRAGVPMVNQSVLLRGVNDDVEVLERLFRGLLRFGVKPYYLFHGDPVLGTLHVRTGVERGQHIMERLRARLSGLALPTFVIDLPDGGGKIAVTPETPVRRRDQNTVELLSVDGRSIRYPDPVAKP